MSFKDYLMKQLDMSEERFDEFDELACRIKDGGVPIYEYLCCTAWFEFFVEYGRANRERRKEI